MAEAAEEATTQPAPPEPEYSPAVLSELSALGGAGAMEHLHDVELLVSIDVGRGRLTIREILELQRTSIIPLNKLSGEPVDIRVGKELLATGEVIVIQDKLRIRVVEIVFPPDKKPEGDQVV